VGARFCTACGQPVAQSDALYCTACGAPRQIGAFVAPRSYGPSPEAYYGGYAAPPRRSGGSEATTVVVILLAVVIIAAIVGSVALALPPTEPGANCCPPGGGPSGPADYQVVLPAGTNYSLGPGQSEDSLFVTNGFSGNESELSGSLQGSGTAEVAMYLLTPAQFGQWTVTGGFPSAGYTFAGEANGSTPLYLQITIPDGTWYLVISNPSSVAAELVSVVQAITASALPAPIYPP
jgi:hypothetical protein